MFNNAGMCFCLQNVMLLDALKKVVCERGGILSSQHFFQFLGEFVRKMNLFCNNLGLSGEQLMDAGLKGWWWWPVLVSVALKSTPLKGLHIAY